MEMKMPREVQARETPFIASFSIRQCILIALGIAAAGLMYFGVLKGKNVGEAVYPLCAISGSPFFALAFFRKHGMKLSDYFPTFLSYKLSRKVRTISYDNIYEKWLAAAAPAQTDHKRRSRFKMKKV